MMTTAHSRTGVLDRPESCHDTQRASLLNSMQMTPRGQVDLVITSSSLLVLFRLSASKSGWLPHAKLIGAQCGLVARMDVMALVERGLAEDKRKGVEITDAGNALVRELTVFASKMKGGES